MVNYAKLAVTAEKLIEKNGRSVTLVKRSTVPETPSEPWKGPVDEVYTDGTPGALGDKAGVVVFAAFVDVSSDSELAEFFTSLGGEVRRGTKAALVAGLSVTPEAIEEFDVVVDGDDVWNIESTDTLRPGTVVLLYALGLKR